MGEPGTIPTAKERIAALLADRDSSVLSLADVEELMERHLAANTEALEMFARWAERERDAAESRVAEMKALLHDVMKDTGIEYRDSSWPALVPSDWFLRVEAALGKEADRG